jgi:putative transcriptional regulator
VTFPLILKISRQIGGRSAPTPVAIFFILLSSTLGLPLSGAAFSLQSTALQFFPSPLTTPPPGSSPSQAALAKGKFLVASRRLGDPNFAETVVLLIEYGQTGAMGVVINRPTEAQLSTLLPEVKGLQRTDAVYLGGPVGRSQMIILVRSRNQPKESLQVFADVYTISGRTALQHLIDEAGTSAQFRAYLGYAGWGPGQLAMEVSQGGWYILPADAATMFDKAAAEMWPELIRRSEAEWVMNLKAPRWPLLLISNHP